MDEKLSQRLTEVRDWGPWFRICASRVLAPTNCCCWSPNTSHSLASVNNDNIVPDMKEWQSASEYLNGRQILNETRIGENIDHLTSRTVRAKAQTVRHQTQQWPVVHSILPVLVIQVPSIDRLRQLISWWSPTPQKFENDRSQTRLFTRIFD